MTQYFIQQWNKQVKPWDIVYSLGDMFWNTVPKKKIREILQQLNGEIHLVIGNHDKLTVQQALRLGFRSACYECILKIAGKYCRVSHYPYRFSKIKHYKTLFKEFLKGTLKNRGFARHMEKRPVNDGRFLIHGHSHSKEKVNGNAINVAVTAWKYKLASLTDIEKLILNQKH
jgi:calcineurin-like phosphoesterase family protein